MRNSLLTKLLFAKVAVLMVFFGSTALAGNIDPYNDGHQWAWGENVGWFDFGVPVGDVTVTNDAVIGFVWAENIGWINLSPDSYGGVINAGDGELLGWAWGENVGWISFSCQNQGVCTTVPYGVSIDTATGLFSGMAWSESVGWINFDLVVPHDVYTVQTSWDPGATIITLVSFTATPGTYRVTLKWETASEIDNAGFNIYRSDSKDGDYEQINDSLIAAVGSATEGAAYELVDEDVENRTKYWYMLEDVDLNGVSTVHGPVRAVPRLIYGIGQ